MNNLRNILLLLFCGSFLLSSQAQVVRETKKLELFPSSKALGFVTFDAIKQGKLKGDTPGQQSKSELAGYSFSLSQPYDASSGMPTGKIKQGTVTILKRNGPSTPQIIQAMATNELLKSVLLEFTRLQADGTTYVYYTVKLINAHIVKFEQSSDDSGLNLKQGTLPLDEITLVYQRIEFEQKEGNTLTTIDGGYQ